MCDPVKSVVAGPGRVKLGHLVRHLRSRRRWRAVLVAPGILSGAGDFVGLGYHHLLLALAGHAHLTCFGLLVRVVLRIGDQIIDPSLVSLELLAVVFEARPLSESGGAADLHPVCLEPIRSSLAVIIAGWVLVANAIWHSLLLWTYRYLAIDLNLSLASLLLRRTVKTLNFLRWWLWVFLSISFLIVFFLLGNLFSRLFMIYKLHLFSFIIFLFIQLFFILDFL